MNRAEKIIAKAERKAKEMDTGCGLYYAGFSGCLQASIRELCCDLAAFEAPMTSSEECTYETDGGTLVIQFDYHPAERMTRDDPGCDADVEITGVYANGMEIGYWCEEHMDFFRDKCFEHMADKKNNDDYDHGQARYEDRMECV